MALVVTLVVAFNFLPQNIGRWQGPCHSMNAGWVVEALRGVGGHSNPTCCILINLNFLHLQAVGMLKQHSRNLMPAHAQESPCETFTTFNLILGETG